MKKQLAVIICALALVIAMPCVAFGLSSATADGETAELAGTDMLGNSADLTFTAEGADWVKIVEADGFPANVPTEYIQSIATGDGKVVAAQTYDIYAGDDESAVTKVTLVYVTDSKFAGLTCYIYVYHNDGTMEQSTQPVGSDGKVTYTRSPSSSPTRPISPAPPRLLP